jgi:hypothetical protein
MLPQDKTRGISLLRAENLASGCLKELPELLIVRVVLYFSLKADIAYNILGTLQTSIKEIASHTTNAYVSISLLNFSEPITI